ncbi:MAG TPA: helix-turn-helix transcriptional regulator [Casimicrobiaceae bacterium]|nr:helix-turn-helix transcriptional regulator [Casimicrobiaceae bacterium]
MSDEPRDLLTISVLIDDRELADRIAAVLGNVAGVRLVRQDEAADLVLTSARLLDTLPIYANATSDATDLDPAALLTPREREVLALLAEGASNKTIARRLGISVHTAKFHVGSLLDKLDASGRTDAVTHAARRGVIEL